MYGYIHIVFFFRVYWTGWKSVCSVPKLVEDYMNSRILLDEFVTHTLPLKEINHAFELMINGKRSESHNHNTTNRTYLFSGINFTSCTANYTSDSLWLARFESPSNIFIKLYLNPFTAYILYVLVQFDWLKSCLLIKCVIIKMSTKWWQFIKNESWI